MDKAAGQSMPRPRQPAPAVLHRSVRFWWVNQNQTFRHETQGGYLWSPKRSQGDRFNLFYDNMREVAPGDLVFSFSDTFIRAIGVVQGHCYECPKPAEFGSTGRNWNAIGWRVRVRAAIAKAEQAVRAAMAGDLVAANQRASRPRRHRARAAPAAPPDRRHDPAAAEKRAPLARNDLALPRLQSRTNTAAPTRASLASRRHPWLTGSSRWA